MGDSSIRTMAITKGQQRNCLQCGQSYEPTTQWQKTCSYACGYKYQNNKRKRDVTNNGFCLRCNANLEHKKSHAIYCSKTCKSMDHTFKHRAKTRSCGTARRREIYERDAKQCYMCRVDLQLNEIELDHLIPVSKGGDSSPNNLAVSCMFCNRSRGATIGIKQIIKLDELRTRI